MTFAVIDNVTIHYDLIGGAEKPTLVFLNSLGSDFRIWHKVSPAFQENYQILHYDKRGHGLSDVPPAPYSIQDHSNDLKGLLDYLKLTNVILIGVSVGGQIALEFAASYPEQVSSLVLSDTGMKLGTAEFWNDRIDNVSREGLEFFAEPILARWFTPSISKNDLAGYKNMLVRTPLAGYAGTCAAIRDADLRDLAKTVQTPALVMTGAQDQSTPPELGQALAAALPNASFELIEGAGHFPCIEQPQQTIKHMKAFLKGIRSK